MSVARSGVHCSSVIGLSLITYLPISSAVSYGYMRNMLGQKRSIGRLRLTLAR